jgi:phage tail tube protein FII
MAGQNVRMMQRIVIDGIPLQREITSWECPPPREKAGELGGSFIAGDIRAGIEKMTAKIVGKGITPFILKMTGRKAGRPITVIVNESWEDEDGVETAIQEFWIGRIATRDRSGGVVTELPEDTLNLSLDEMKRIVNGIQEWHVSRKASICDLGDGDILAKHRSNVGMF